MHLEDPSVSGEVKQILLETGNEMSLADFGALSNWAKDLCLKLNAKIPAKTYNSDLA